MIRWIEPHSVQVPASFAELHVPALVQESLVRRGITDLAAARLFLDADRSASTPFPGIEAAVHMVHAAVRSGAHICVWGDFDVDGQTSTTVLVQALQALSADVTYYIPVRARESHGVHVASLKPVLERGCGLLITCDTGITAHEALEYARLSGARVIVTDHHDPGGRLPDADAIINPKLLPAGHPCADLAGVGVAFKLAEALLGSTPAAAEALLDLVALGLIADVARLRGETRLLARAGIQALRTTQRLGLKLIAELSGSSLETLTEETIGFTFAPRLNALGRLSDANQAVELLLSQDPARARVLATQIEGLNAQRRLLTSQVYGAASAQLEADPSLLAGPAVVLSHPNWPAGVIGIVASRLVERYQKPVVLLAGSDDGVLRGSARSVEGLHITEAIAAQRHLLRGFGGHPMAAGLSMDPEQLPAFRRGLDRAIEAQLGTLPQSEPGLTIDAWLGFEEITPELAGSLECLAPFGAGNPPLTFATRNVRLRSTAEIGRTREHLRLLVEDPAGRTEELMWWGGAGEALPEQGAEIDAAYRLRASTYRGRRGALLEFAGFRVREAARPIDLPSRSVRVVDLRAEPQPAHRLAQIKAEYPHAQVWAEGSERLLGRPRQELQPADILVIYTSPPSAAELSKAVGTVYPGTVYLFAVQGADENPEDLIPRLAGLCKYSINQRGGRAALQQLAAATGQREAAVRHGLEWLRLGGHIELAGEGELEIGRGESAARPALQREFLSTLTDILEETAAYHRYYASVPDPAILINA